MFNCLWEQSIRVTVSESDILSRPRGLCATETDTLGWGGKLDGFLLTEMQNLRLELM
jgi:hypothetical protein